MSTESSGRQSRHEIERLFYQAWLFTWIGGTVVGIVFTIIQLKNIPLPDWLNATKPEYVQAITLWIYYLCWIAGCPFDAYYQKWVYAAAPNKINVRLQSVLLVAFLILAAVIFIFVRHNEKYFSVTLGAFLLINIFGWIHIVGLVRPIITASRELYHRNQDFVGLEQLEIVVRHMTGRWQIWRFVGMVLIIGALITISFVEGIRANIAVQVNLRISSIDVKTVSLLLPDALFVLFVAFAEGVIWFRRVRTSVSVHTIEALETQYRLTPRVHVTQPEPDIHS